MRAAMTAAFPGDHEASIRVLGDGRPRRGVPARLLRLASDERLVEGVRAGSEPAFEALFDRYHRGVLGFCRHMLGSVEEAEDAVQHTFLSAYRELSRSDSRVVFRPWLYTIARNRCLTMLRARVRQSGDELVEPPTEHLAAAVERRHDLRDLLRDVARLPEEQRAALVLSELADMAHDEIADVLGCRRDKVKALVFQARSSLISSRLARETPCTEIREQLANLRGGSLRRNELRRHVNECAGCREFRDQVRAQRRDLSLVLPVAPTVGLKSGVIGAVVGSSAAGPGAVVAGGGAATGALVAKVLVVAAIAGGGTVAVRSASDDSGDRPARAQPGKTQAPAPHESSAAPRVTELRSAAPAAAPGRVAEPDQPARGEPKHAAKPKHGKAEKPAHPGKPATTNGRAKHPTPGEHPGRHANRGKPDNTPEPARSVKPAKPAKPEHAAKPEKAAKLGKAPKPVKAPKPAKAPKLGKAPAASKAPKLESAPKAAQAPKLGKTSKPAEPAKTPEPAKPANK
jgi:RNA polymerase sigma factor (sigma-70 family)